MSELIKHECGIVLVRLLKPLEYYLSHYGSALYGLDKLYLLMEKQHNRGQDGAGIGCLKLDMPPGSRYMTRFRSNTSNPIIEIFDRIHSQLDVCWEKNNGRLKDINWMKSHLDFVSELYLGHLRYGTYGKYSVEQCHPFLRENNWMSKNLAIAGNFNLTNVSELFQSLIDIGQHPNETSDNITILEKFGHFLDDENEALYRKYRDQGYTKKEISPLIAENLNIANIISNASKYWDGGYVIAGMIGHGASFVMRDPNGIRPAYYYHDDEVIVAASERPVIQTAFDVPLEKVKEVEPGHALIIQKNGSFEIKQFTTPSVKKACSFERIYFSRGTDADIYHERKSLGKQLVPAVLKAINHDLQNTIFSYIPNTAIAAFNGMVEGLTEFCDNVKSDRILELKSNFNNEKLNDIMALKPRIEQIAVKDVKLRTFITEDKKRDDLVTHVYDVTYGVVRKGLDTLVVIDDSIVRGTTLKQSILRMLNRLKPKKIVVVSSAPQIRYPDCYGIDMAKLNDFIAFRAAIELLREKQMPEIISRVYNLCKKQEGLPKEKVENHVKKIYKPFTAEQISAKAAEMLKPAEMEAQLEIVFQSIEDLHASCPDHTGDWYFTGDYPTAGGNKVVNRSYINFIEGKNQRSYQ